MTKSAKIQTQIAKFREAARELGASDSEASFNKKLKKIAKAKPATIPVKRREKKPGK